MILELLINRVSLSWAGHFHCSYARAVTAHDYVIQSDPLCSRLPQLRFNEANLQEFIYGTRDRRRYENTQAIKTGGPSFEKEKTV